jgi:Zn-dependent M28 family amino/carboxypeptidase
MSRQQELLERHFTQLGAKVSRQAFRARHPQTGAAVEMSNLVVEWSPEAKERLLLCCHYDTRPFPDRDPQQPQGRFVGANDGGSGTAVLMELGRHMKSLQGKRGVDFVLFDGEELVFRETDPYFLGSTYFAQSYKATPPAHRYRAGLLLDMVGDARLSFGREPISMRYARFVVDDVWNAASRLGVREFEWRSEREVRDDHVPLNEIARIPTADLIDFDYPYWHTEADLPDKCSAASLEKTGKVIYEWLRTTVNR